jgi:uncharacterized repeat protein (TIGR01451 family)
VSGFWPNWHKAGVYGALAVGNIYGDGKAEVAVGRDFLYLNAYKSDGYPLPGWPIETYLERNSGSYHTDYRLVHGLSAPVFADINGDGTDEYVVVANMNGPSNNVTILNSAVLVLNPDGTRFQGWEKPALGSGVLTQEDLPRLTPAIADLDGDGDLEIISATYDGWIRAYRADKTVLWAYDYARGEPLFASEPIIGDINNDGKFETIFGTYIQSPSNNNWDSKVGILALDADGNEVPGFPLAIPTPGSKAAPTLADLDSDGYLELLAATLPGQVYVWDLDSPYNPTLLPWPTSRHDIQRTATYQPLSPMEHSRISLKPLHARQGDTVNITIRIRSTTQISNVIVTSSIPSGLVYNEGSLSATQGSPTQSQGVITWSGGIYDPLDVEITYSATVETSLTELLKNIVTISCEEYGIFTREAHLRANYHEVFLPLIVP